MRDVGDDYLAVITGVDHAWLLWIARVHAADFSTGAEANHAADGGTVPRNPVLDEKFVEKTL